MNTGQIGLLVGLGNPGIKFSQTRHNVGFMAVKRFAAKEGVYFKQQKKLFGALAEVRNGDQLTRLLLPNTFMNESGKSIQATLNWFGIDTNQMIILVDDIDLPLGKLRLRTKGSSGGHNGLRSAIQHIGTDNFKRLKIGVGKPISDSEDRRNITVSHVLGNFSLEESEVVDKVIKKVITGLELINSQSLEIAANYINTYPQQVSNQ